MTVEPLKGARNIKKLLHINSKVRLGYVHDRVLEVTSLLTCY